VAQLSSRTSDFVITASDISFPVVFDANSEAITKAVMVVMTR